MSCKALADLLFPEIDTTPADYVERYRERDLKPGAFVTRYAPSPTGFQHIEEDPQATVAAVREFLRQPGSGL